MKKVVKKRVEIQQPCERCGIIIPSARMKALPETRLCVQCSQEVGSDFEVVIVEENLGTSVVSKPIVHKRWRCIEPLEERTNES